ARLARRTHPRRPRPTPHTVRTTTPTGLTYTSAPARPIAPNVTAVTFAGRAIEMVCSPPGVGIDLVRRTLTSYSGTRILEANGDVFAVYDPAGDLPPERQLPWATIVTSDNPYDATSHLDRLEVFRLNFGLPRARFGELVDTAVE